VNEYSFIFAEILRARDENKEKTIKEMAVQMIVDHGFDGLSMQKLAKKAGVSPATIYIYFKDKEELIETIAIEEINKMTQVSLKGFSPKMSFEEGLRVQWKNRINYWLEFTLSAKFTEQAKNSPIGEKIKEKVKIEFANIMREFVQNAVAKGDLKPMKAEIYWSLAFAPLYQLIRFHMYGMGLRGEKFELTDEIFEETFNNVLKSLKP
jgi:TetR/AcrR family transcriptional regulator, multidrug resistance operon repressor